MVKKSLSIFCFFFLFLTTSNASADMTAFEVLNGTLLVPFESKNNVYTILLNQGEDTVQFDYQLASGATIEIINPKYDPNKLENKMEIMITGEKKEEKQIYEFYLEQEEQAIPTFKSDQDLAFSPSKKERSPYLIPAILISYIFIISILFYFLIIRFWKSKTLSKRGMRKNHLHKMK